MSLMWLTTLQLVTGGEVVAIIEGIVMITLHTATALALEMLMSADSAIVIAPSSTEQEVKRITARQVHCVASIVSIGRVPPVKIWLLYDCFTSTS
jgi:hypothetical protein